MRAACLLRGRGPIGTVHRQGSASRVGRARRAPLISERSEGAPSAAGVLRPLAYSCGFPGGGGLRLRSFGRGRHRMRTAQDEMTGRRARGGCRLSSEEGGRELRREAGMRRRISVDVRARGCRRAAESRAAASPTAGTRRECGKRAAKCDIPGLCCCVACGLALQCGHEL